MKLCIFVLQWEQEIMLISIQNPFEQNNRINETFHHYEMYFYGREC